MIVERVVRVERPNHHPSKIRVVFELLAFEVTTEYLNLFPASRATVRPNL